MRTNRRVPRGKDILHGEHLIISLEPVPILPTSEDTGSGKEIIDSTVMVSARHLPTVKPEKSSLASANKMSASKNLPSTGRFFMIRKYWIIY